MEPQIRYCTTTDGASIAYATMGAGPTVIAPAGPWPLSGAWSTPPVVRKSWAAVSKEFTFVRYDGRGMGLSGASAASMAWRRSSWILTPSRAPWTSRTSHCLVAASAG